MNILVCISKAPETTTKIAFNEDNTAFKEDDVQYIVNPYDEWYALVRGLELKESLGGNVTIVTIGPQEDEPVIRKALAIGADNAVRVDADPKDAYSTAFQLAEYAKSENFDLVLLGKETINYNGAQVGGMLAELMDMPYISLATSLESDGKSATVEREIAGGSEVLKLDAPFVLSCSKGMAEQRIPNMRGIMAARKKPLDVREAANCEDLTSFVSFQLPGEKAECKYVDPENMEELVDLLHNEAKVI